ncbi:Aminopeptidase 2 [bacterium HR35]|nr:Aminopeptidase 2 [bacterium HR35]
MRLITGISQELIYFEERYIEKIARDMVEISTKVQPEENVLIFFDIGGKQLALKLAEYSLKRGARVYYLIRDMDLNALILKNSKEKEIARFYSFDNVKFFEADVTFLIRCPRDEFVFENIEGEKLKIFNEAQEPAVMNFRVNYTRWCLIYWPTKAKAKIEKMKFEDYLKLYFRACFQNWQKIKKENSLIKKILDKGKTLVLKANIYGKDPKKKTQLEMSIEGMTFANSTIDYNYPGSEIFSAPQRESVNGQVFAQGVYSYNGKYMEDIYLRFENGKVVEAQAKKGEKNLIEILETDEGAKYLGEIALGTNPGIRRRVFDPLLNEKVGGSFHFALGKAYELKEYGKEKVNLFNGNLSKIHWDITIPMLKKYGGGEVWVDGKLIQKDGKFLVKGIKILNSNLRA